MNKQINEAAKEEDKLRHIIRTLLVESDVDADTNPAPYSSTPVNALADAFNQILPVIKTGLRKLAKPEERESYRAHVLQKFQSIFANFEGLDAQAAGAIGEGDLTEQEEDKDKISIKVDDPDRIVPDVEKDRFKEKKPDPETELENEFGEFKIAGEDPTGARIAFETISDSNIEQVLSDKRKVLFTPEYKQQFKDYALYNVDLWLLTYEKELSDVMGQEPAFTETEMPRPAGAQETAVAQEFAGGEGMPEEELGMPEEEPAGLEVAGAEVPPEEDEEATGPPAASPFV